ncbi:MAG: sugar ABC transporter permease [Actinomyces sp.]|uniref:carbohydrate ABC transporter permease n=1 Tax=Actinomyces sp. TaxID=29317 RepID=UPI0026DCE60F|nr:sugar ABC transporter permease [Actinomyces sp.]MDO4242374.1 sugar ABC transporter permease [Actinomyces sp.]
MPAPDHGAARRASRDHRPGKGRATVAPVRPRRSWRVADRRHGYAFVAPQTIGLLLFTLLPFLAALALAFTQWNGFGTPSFVGVQNFVDQLTDPLLRRAVLNTLAIAAITVPVGLGLAIIVAVLLQGVRLKSFYMVMIFTPVVTSSVAVALIWQQLLHREGIVSRSITAVLPVTPPDWLGDPRLALVSVCLVTVWSSLGLNVVIFQAGLQSIPPSVLEAATIDGAGPVRRFVSIILPLLSPTIFFQSVVAVISSLKTFDLVFILVSHAGPDHATRTIVYHIYDLGFRSAQFGLASAASVILLVLTAVITLIQFAGQKRFVHYED